MTEIWLLAIIPALAWLMAKRRTRKAIVEAEVQLFQEDHVSVEELGRLVRELSPTLRPPPKVPTANFPPTSNHVWNSPSGKRVYMN